MHLSDRDLLSRIRGELSPSRQLAADDHLAACHKCRTCLEQLEHAARQVTAYRNQCTELQLPRQNGRGRDLLAAQIDNLFRDAAPNTGKRQRKNNSRRIAFSAMNPTLATAMALAVASIICTFLWLQQTRLTITSNALLVRAEAWDSLTVNHPTAGVICQTIRIQTPKQSLERAIYRDAQGQRRIRAQKLASSEEQLKEKLATAGVTWDAPLSASAYQGWHDSQRVRQDQIRRSGPHLLMLTTTTPDGDVAAQSLTVRDSDFHPVDRKVTFRDSETIEIAELSYQVLPWAAVSADAFEPAGTLYSDNSNRLQPYLVPRLPGVLTSAQLNEAELGARLVLNKLHADTGEQLQVERSAYGIEVKGLVETEQRKLELVAQLRMLPHLKASILSIEELKESPDNEAEVSSLKVSSMSAQPSPLDSYFVAHGRDANTLQDLFQQLLSSAITASQESHSITSLLERFKSEDGMTDLAKATLTELIYSHREKLLAAVQKEQKLLTEVGDTSYRSKLSEVPAAGELVSAAERNLSLCKELTLGGNSPRSAESILPELAESLDELRIRARQAQIGSQITTAQSGK